MKKIILSSMLFVAALSTNALANTDAVNKEARKAERAEMKAKCEANKEECKELRKAKKEERKAKKDAE